ncbi:hypothetical protein CYY_009921, partial [Polysphondylium violaceum]
WLRNVKKYEKFTLSPPAQLFEREMKTLQLAALENLNTKINYLLRKELNHHQTEGPNPYSSKIKNSIQQFLKTWGLPVIF